MPTTKNQKKTIPLTYEDINPCVCGEKYMQIESTHMWYTRQDKKELIWSRVECPECGLAAIKRNTTSDAVESWNVLVQIRSGKHGK